MKEMDLLSLSGKEEYIKSSNGFLSSEETEDDIVIIQLIVQGKPITVNEDVLVRYSKYFGNLFQSLPPPSTEYFGNTANGKTGKSDQL